MLLSSLVDQANKSSQAAYMCIKWEVNIQAYITIVKKLTISTIYSQSPTKVTQAQLVVSDIKWQEKNNKTNLISCWAKHGTLRQTSQLKSPISSNNTANAARFEATLFSKLAEWMMNTKCWNIIGTLRPRLNKMIRQKTGQPLTDYTFVLC